MLEHKGWYEGKNLPHLDAGNTTQFVTFRLGDSIPINAMEALEEELRSLKDNKEIEKTRRIERRLDMGSGSCLLKESRCAEIVRDSIKFLNGKRYDLRAWVVLPNHVHLLVRFASGQTLAKAMHSLKSYTSNELGLIHPEIRPIWQADYFDRYIRTEEHYWRTVRYIHENPSKANLCKHREDFP